VENEISAPIRPDRADNDVTSGQGLLSDDSAIENMKQEFILISEVMNKR
jgi:hypothetical protein